MMSLRDLGLISIEELQNTGAMDQGGFGSIPPGSVSQYPNPQGFSLVSNSSTLSPYFHPTEPPKWTPCSPPEGATAYDYQRATAVESWQPKTVGFTSLTSRADQCDATSLHSANESCNVATKSSAISANVHEKGISYQSKRSEQRRVLSQKKREIPDYQPKLGRPYELEQTEERKRTNARRRAYYQQCKEAGVKKEKDYL